MAKTRYILEKIRVEGELCDLITRSDGENITVTYDGEEMTLAAALASILTSLSGLSSGESVDGKISAAIDGLIGGAPETYDTLREIADYIETHKDAADALSAAIGGKVDKEEGKGLSAEDFTAALKEKLENLPDTLENATEETAGLMSAEDKKRLDGLRGVRYGTEMPADMRDGEMFVRVISGE